MIYTRNLLFFSWMMLCSFAFHQEFARVSHATTPDAAPMPGTNLSQIPDHVFPEGAIGLKSAFTSYLFFPGISSSSADFNDRAMLDTPGDCTADGPVKIVVIGSSTAEGHGVATRESWVGRYEKYLKDINSGNEVVNLAKGGYNTYHLLPTGTQTPVEDKPDPERNITEALSRNPDGIIINLPSNDAWKGYDKEVQMANFKIMYDKAQEQGVPVWITTTQPRNKGLNNSRLKIQLEVRDAIEETYGEYALDFWTDITTSDNKIKSSLALGDGIHLNPDGHKVLFEEIVDKKVYESIRDLKYQVFTSVKSGSYADKSTWNLKVVPGNEATVIIKGNHTVNLTRDVSVKGVKVEKNGKFDLKNYQLVANCSMEVEGILDADQAALEFSGTENSSMAGFSVVKTLKINKPKGTISLGNDLKVTGTLDLTQGTVALEGHDLTVEQSASVKGGSSASYIKTTGQGNLIFALDDENDFMNKPLLFPVGDTENYTPFTFILKAADISNAKLFMRVGVGEPSEAGSANPILSRYWELRQEGLSNYLYDVKFQYLDGDVKSSSGKSEEDLKVIKYSDKEGWQIGGQVDVSNNILFADGISSFSIFSGGNNIEGAAPLPVELLDFEVQATAEGHAALLWKTASEQNNDYFAIERSADAELWASLGKVKGGGNSNDVLQYRFTDRSPLGGRSFYRLKQVDFDGQFEYSPVVAFFSDLPMAFDVTVKPNPVGVRENLTLELVTPEPGGQATIEVHDVLGRVHLLKEVQDVKERAVLSVQPVLRPGLYLVTVRQGYLVTQKKLLVR